MLGRPRSARTSRATRLRSLLWRPHLRSDRGNTHRATPARGKPLRSVKVPLRRLHAQVWRDNAAVGAGGSPPGPRPPTPLCAVRNAQHYAAQSDARQHSGRAAAAARAVAPRHGARAISRRTTKRTRAAAPRRRGPATSAISPLRLCRRPLTHGCRAKRGIRAVARTLAAGSGCTPRRTLCSSAGPRTVGVEPLVVYDPQRTYGCERGVCPVHKWDGVQALDMAGLTRTCEPSYTRAHVAPARAILCILKYCTR